ncbi:MAG: ribosome maturation factor RimP [Bacillota bacterium]|nr:ribosome maturation factor RimP [Bacillota bacterium]
MAKKKITEIAAEMMADFLQQEGYELYNIEFVKEGKDWFLRVYVDIASGEGYVGTEDCEKVSRFLSEKLDEEDPIEQNYYLEVSSPGMDRPLLKKEHYERYVGSEVEIRLYKGKDGTKNIVGVLEGIAEDMITVTDHDNKKWELELSEIAKANLAVVF